MLHAYLLAASACVILALGLAHLLFTFVGCRLHPRSAECRASMEAAYPVLTRQTTIWRAWIGFNASHSFGAILFGLVYGYLALAQPAFLFSSVFLLAVGAAMLVGLALLGKLYWFSTPFGGIVLSAVLYLGALLALPGGA